MSHFPKTERYNMATIEVGKEKNDVGGMYILVEKQATSVCLKATRVARWTTTIHEVIGRGVFSDHIACMVETETMMKFVMVNPQGSDELMKSMVLQLITQAASLWHERELNKARRSHPSSGSLIDYGANRYHNDKPRLVNKPPSVRKR